MEWLDQVFKMVREDKRDYYQLMSALFPLAKTPMDAEGGRSLQRYSKKVSEAIDEMVPGAKEKRRKEIAKKVESGTVVVILDGGEKLPEEFIKEATIR